MLIIKEYKGFKVIFNTKLFEYRYEKKAMVVWDTTNEQELPHEVRLELYNEVKKEYKRCLV